MLAFVLVVAQASDGPGPVAAAALRPLPCAEGGSQRGNVWERAKSPELRRYCDLLASASSKLVGSSPSPAAALDAAKEAETIVAGSGAALVLEGRALAALGHLPEALATFEEVRARDPRAFDEPLPLLSLARVLAATGHPADAARTYRTLLPRSSGLSAADRAAIATEAGLSVMQLGADAIDEAIADLREALRVAQGDGEKLVVLALALALDRSGQGAEARALLAERARGEPRATVAAWSRKAAVALAPGEAEALVALALEGADDAAAREAWKASGDASSPGPWTSYAHDRLAARPAGSPRKPR